MLGILLAVIFLEIILRLFFFMGENFFLGLTPHRTTLKFYEHPIHGSAFVPGQQGWFVSATGEYYSWTQINSQGWPDQEHSLIKPAGVYRIIFLGDSFVENLQTQLENRFFKQFEKKISNLTNKKIEVIALGRGNTGTAQQYLILKEKALAYQPDLIVQLFFTGNDIKNNSPVLMANPYLPYFKINDQNSLVVVPQQQRSEGKIKELLKNLRVVELLLYSRQTWQERFKNSQIDYPVDYHVYDLNYNQSYQAAWEVTKKLILNSKAVSQEKGAKYLLVALASSEQVDSNIQAEIFKTYPKFKPTAINFEKPDQLLKEFCQESQVDCLFTLADFRQFNSAYPTSSTHFRLDGHLNQVGTELLTDFLIRNLAPQL